MINIDTRLLDNINQDECWLLIQIVKRCNNELVCWPSNKTLREDTKWSLKKLQMVKGQLLDKNLLVSKPRFKSESQSSNAYYINTEFIGVFVSGKNITVGLQDEGDRQNLPTPPDESNGGNPPESKRGNKVLASEVLTSNTESKDSVPKKPFVGNALDLSNEPINNVAAGKNLVYARCVDFWLKTIHPGWTFGAMHGKAMKSIITKIKTVSTNSGMDGTDSQMIALFQKMMTCLPEWYKDKDLPVINSKFNEIITEIQNGGKKQQGFNSKNSADRFSDFAG